MLNVIVCDDDGFGSGCSCLVVVVVLPLSAISRAGLILNWKNDNERASELNQKRKRELGAAYSEQ